ITAQAVSSFLLLSFSISGISGIQVSLWTLCQRRINSELGSTIAGTGRLFWTVAKSKNTKAGIANIFPLDFGISAAEYSGNATCFRPLGSGKTVHGMQCR